jgi:ketosteroid isomerase-like protein
MAVSAQNAPSSDEELIRKLVHERVEGIRARDAERAMAGVAADVRSFDVVNPLQNAGAASARRRAEVWFSSFDGPIGVEVKDLHVAAAGGVGFSYAFQRYTGRKRDGGAIDMWVRTTVCYRKIDGAWKITHEHQSVPFDPETGRASLALAP